MDADRPARILSTPAGRLPAHPFGPSGGLRAPESGYSVYRLRPERIDDAAPTLDDVAEAENPLRPFGPQVVRGQDRRPPGQVLHPLRQAGRGAYAGRFWGRGLVAEHCARGVLRQRRVFGV